MSGTPKAKDDAAISFPVVIAELARNDREIVRIALDRFNGRHTIDVRTWWRDADVLKPGKAGITLSIKHLPALARALQGALERARELGLLDDGGEQ